MKWIARLTTTSLLCLSAGLTFGQQSELLTDNYRSAAAVEAKIASYLDSAPMQSILTPGEAGFLPPLTLKTGQVVVASARSYDFDPALEIDDSNGKALVSNDDRYPGNQSPLLFWRCPADGDYSLRVRGYHDKSGGQYAMTYKVYDSADLDPNHPASVDMDAQGRILLRISMAAGDFVQVTPRGAGLDRIAMGAVISPTGLPSPDLTGSIGAAIQNGFISPVAGEYYVLFTNQGDHRKIEFDERLLTPTNTEVTPTSAVAKKEVSPSPVWSIAVKKGQFLRFASNAPSYDSQLVIMEAPDVSGYDLSTQGKNPFYPLAAPKSPPESAYTSLPARAGDVRVADLRMNRDARLWIASTQPGTAINPFVLSVKPASIFLSAGNDHWAGTLKIGCTDYWSFDASPGDVMSFTLDTKAFRSVAALRDPNLRVAWSGTAQLDQETQTWDMIFQLPGTQLVSVSCSGDGGGGVYSLTRRVFHAMPFGIGSPAKGELGSTAIQVWKLNVKPGVPLLVRWTSSNWSYRTEIRDDRGGFVSLPFTDAGPHLKCAVIYSDTPRTYLFSFYRVGQDADYSLDVENLPAGK